MAASSVRAVPTLVLFLLGTTLAGCGGGSSTDPAGPGNGSGTGSGNGSGTGSDAPSTASVSVDDDVFNPSELTVARGAVVTWTWGGYNAHDVTWVSSGLSSSDTKDSGSHQVTMPQTAGQLVYYCTLHGSPTSGMRGTITVQ